MGLKPDVVQEPVPFKCHPTLGFYSTLDTEGISLRSFHSFSLIGERRSGSMPRTHLCIRSNYKHRKCNLVVMTYDALQFSCDELSITHTLSVQYLVTYFK